MLLFSTTVIWFSIVLVLVGVYLIYSAFTKKVVTENGLTRKPPPLYRPGKFMIGVCLIGLTAYILLDPSQSVRGTDIADGRREVRTMPMPTTMPLRPTMPELGDNPTLKDLAGALKLTPAYAQSEANTVVKEASQRLIDDGRKLSLSFDGVVDVQPFSDYDEAIVNLVKTIYQEGEGGEQLSGDPLNNLNDYQLNDVSTQQIQQDCESWLSERLNGRTQLKTGLHETNKDDLVTTVRFWLENDLTGPVPNLLELRETSITSSNGAVTSERERELEKLLSLRLRYTINFSIGGREKMVEGELIPEYERYTWRHISAPYRLIGQLVGEQLADEVVVEGAAFMKE
jgi:hypothetical protein